MRCGTWVWSGAWIVLAALGSGCQESAQTPFAQASTGPEARKVAARVPQASRLDDELIQAAQAGNAGRIVELVAQGASVQATNKWGKTALHVACEAGRVPAARALLENGADIQVQIPTVYSDDGVGYDGAEAGSPLTYAAAHGRVEILRMLLDRGAGVNVPNLEGKTPLMCAAAAPLPTSDHVDCVTLLLERGADAWARTPQGRSAISLAGSVSLLSGVQTNEARAQTQILDLLTRAGTRR